MKNKIVREERKYIGNRKEAIKQAVRYAQDAVYAINRHLGYDAAHVARHNQSGELAAIVIDNGSVDVRGYPSIDETSFTLPALPRKHSDEKHGLYFDSSSPNRLEIW